MNWEPLSHEDIQARQLSMMHQQVRIGDRVIGHVTEVQPMYNEQGFYNGRFEVHIESDDPFMPRQVIEKVHWDYKRPGVKLVPVCRVCNETTEDGRYEHLDLRVCIANVNNHVDALWRNIMPEETAS